MTLQDRIERMLSARGKSVDFSAIRALVEMEDRADGRGPYISKWSASLGAKPTEVDGFSAHEIHGLQA